MNSLYSKRSESDQITRRHYAVALTALIISVVLHIGLIMSIENMKLRFAIIDKVMEKLDKKTRPFTLNEIKRAPAESTKEAVKDKEAKDNRPELLRDERMIVSMPDASTIEPPASDAKIPTVTFGASPNIEDINKDTKWQSRQEVIRIEKEVTADDKYVSRRRMIPKIDRTDNARDITVPADRESVSTKEAGGGIVSGTGLLPFAPSLPDHKKIDIDKTKLDIKDEDADSSKKALTEKPVDISKYKALEKLLKIKVTTYTPLFEKKYLYFQIEVNSMGADILPSIPKDVLLVQDCSHSMSENRLRNCKDGLIRCLAEIHDKDRFNVVSFSEEAQYCFKDWADKDAANINAATNFIMSMKPGGNTDIFFSMSELLKLKRTSGRPVIVILASDGMPTKGITESSDVIGEFSKLNDGALSVFSLSTIGTANKYLLDLLSYCNRGKNYMIRAGRWGIPEELEGISKEVSRPILDNIHSLFPGNEIEVYPDMPCNMYLDRPLLLFGRCNLQTEKLVFQITGQADKIKCDMVFDVSLKDAKSSRDSEIMKNWAMQKIYNLMAEYARKPQNEILQGIFNTGKQYEIDIPYKKEINKK